MGNTIKITADFKLLKHYLIVKTPVETSGFFHTHSFTSLE